MTTSQLSQLNTQIRAHKEQCAELRTLLYRLDGVKQMGFTDPRVIAVIDGDEEKLTRARQFLTESAALLRRLAAASGLNVEVPDPE